MLTAKDLIGNWATLLLPINADDSIDYARLSGELDHFIGAGVNGIYSNGTAGEFHNQTEDEFDRIQQLMAEKCKAAQMLFQVGASHPSPVITLERIKRTLALQPAAYQVILPDWVIANEEEQVVFLKRIADTTGDIPIVLYNPPHAKTVLGPAALCKLASRLPTLIGIKTAGGDDEWYREMLACNEKLSVFVPGHFLATGVKSKVASGAYSNIACLSPKGAQWWWELMQTDIEAATGIQQKILQFFEDCISPLKKAGYSNPALDKFLAAVGGWSDIGTRLRWPYQWIDASVVPAAREKAREYLPEFF